MNGSVLMGEFKNKKIYAGKVAVKNLASAGARYMLEAYLTIQEAYIMTGKSHPNIVQGIKVFCDDDGYARIAMELMDSSLETLYKIHVPDSFGEAVHLMPVGVAIYILHEVNPIDLL